MELHFLHEDKKNGLRTWSCHLGRCWPLGNSLALVIKWTNGTEIFGNSGKSEKKIIPRKVSHFLSKTFHRDEPFHLNSSQKSRIFHTNGTRSKWQQVKNMSMWFIKWKNVWFKGHVNNGNGHQNWLYNMSWFWSKVSSVSLRKCLEIVSIVVTKILLSKTSKIISNWAIVGE